MNSEPDQTKKSESSYKTPANPDFIPTAVVIKNIPFAVKKEQMIQYIDSLQLPLPYAFNYHFDNGVFRGLAFANFNNLKDTNLIIQHLNGKIMNGRKLRVEYKKIQQNADGTTMSRTASNMSLSSMASSMSYMNNQNNNNDETHSYHSTTINNSNQFSNNVNETNNLVRYHAPMIQKETMLQSSQPPLDFNDGEVLEIYTQLVLFKDRQTLYSEISWQQQYLTPQHKKIINTLCSFLNLYEISDPVYLSVRRQNQQQTHDGQAMNSPLQGYTNANIVNKQIPLSTGGSIYMQSNNGSVHSHQQHNLYQNSIHDDNSYLIKPPQGLFPSRNITPAAQSLGYMQQNVTTGSYMSNLTSEKDPQVITTSQAGNYNNISLTNPLLRSSQTGSSSLIRPQLSNVPSSNSFLLQQGQQQLQPQTTSGSIQSVNSLHSMNSSVTQGMLGLSLQTQHQQQQQQRYKQHPLLQRTQHQQGNATGGNNGNLQNQQDEKFSL
ncbi:hypothetical protein ACO0R3_001901 [Hanseniaspora guilliermondii]